MSHQENLGKIKQYQLSNNVLTLKVKRSPLFVRIVMFIFSFLCFILPIMGMLSFISSGNGFHFKFLIIIFLFSLFGFYLLRMALWNTYGMEIIQFDGPKVSYIANYGWFNDAQKTEVIESLKFQIHPVGYVEDKLGTLLIGNNDTVIECVTKMSIRDIEKFIEKLNIELPNS